MKVVYDPEGDPVTGHRHEPFPPGMPSRSIAKCSCGIYYQKIGDKWHQMDAFEVMGARFSGKIKKESESSNG